MEHNFGMEQIFSMGTIISQWYTANKFEEYHTITIPQDIYNDFLKSQRSIYPKGTVTYYGEKYTIPASVFTNKANWENGSFTYSWPNASGALYNLKATGTAGHSIFWRIEKK